MKYRLQTLQEAHRGTILEKVIEEIIEDENPMQSLLFFQEQGVE